eukprot:6198028-Pleurochrysis_carterae.AAC.5
MVYTAPNYCERCLRTNMCGMRHVWPRLNYRINVTAEPWVHKVGQEASKRFMKLKHAELSLMIMLSPVTETSLWVYTTTCATFNLQMEAGTCDAVRADRWQPRRGQEGV